MPRHSRPGRRAHGADATHSYKYMPSARDAPPDAVAARPLNNIIRKVSCVHGEAAPRTLELEAHAVHVVPARLLLVRVDVERRVVGCGMHTN